MKPRFETINGQLCHMVEPTPLTLEATFPCVVRLIQDDSPMGLCNRWKYSEKQDFLKKDWTISSLENNLNKVKDIHYSQFEIIGYPVADGSAEWALWQMQQGNCVIHEGLTPCNIHCGMVTWLDSPESKHFTMQSLDKWLQYCPFSNGWQLYEPEPPKEPAPFAVGDWVEFIDVGGRQSQGKYLSNADGNTILVLHIPSNKRCVVPTTKIIRKLKQSEVRVKVMVEGTVSRTANDGSVFLLWTGTDPYKHASIVRFADIDPETAKTVRELIQAQVEK